MELLWWHGKYTVLIPAPVQRGSPRFCIGMVLFSGTNFLVYVHGPTACGSLLCCICRRRLLVHCTITKPCRDSDLSLVELRMPVNYGPSNNVHIVRCFPTQLGAFLMSSSLFAFAATRKLLLPAFSTLVRPFLCLVLELNNDTSLRLPRRGIPLAFVW